MFERTTQLMFELLTSPERQAKRRARRERLAKLFGIMVGQVFGTSMVGWVVSGLIVIAVAATIWRYVL